MFCLIFFSFYSQGYGEFVSTSGSTEGDPLHLTAKQSIATRPGNIISLDGICKIFDRTHIASLWQTGLRHEMWGEKYTACLDMRTDTRYKTDWPQRIFRY